MNEQQQAILDTDTELQNIKTMLSDRWVKISELFPNGVSGLKESLANAIDMVASVQDTVENMAAEYDIALPEYD